MKKPFEPRILAFCCNWCAYSGADLAGTSRLQYPANVKIVRVMCSGRVDPGHIFRAFEKGIDGVLVAGCHPGDCHYNSGNEKAEIRMENARKVADVIGLGADRIRLEWISASEGTRFAEVVKEFVKEIKNKGPNPLGGGK
ncbi:MAG: hydrogenase iron-sulfur subunit [Thermoplasmata archaeon]